MLQRLIFGLISIAPMEIAKYLAFVSFSGTDDDGNFKWISTFCQQLQVVLRGRLRNSESLHQYRKDPAASGTVPDRMADAIARSAAMVLFVHEGWLSTPACVDELKAFAEIHGKQGLKDRRLLMVAMSKPAAMNVVASQEWKKYVGDDKFIWIDFFDPVVLVKPLAPNPPGSSTLEAGFQSQMDLLVEEIVRCWKLGLPRPQADSRAAPGQGRRAFGFAREELASSIQGLAQASAKRYGHEVVLLAGNDLFNMMPMLTGVDTLVLPFNEGRPLMPTRSLPMGHLQLQAETWLESGKSPETLLWLDLRDVPPPQRVTDEEHTQLVELTTRGRLVRPADIAGANTQSVAVDQAKIYIESNARELKHWNILGQAIRERWSVISSGTPPPLFLIHNAMPVDEEERLKKLHDADGVVVLWGSRTPDSLGDQIQKLQKFLPGFQSFTELPPRIVAYLTPPNERRQDAIPAYFWDVLRFNASLAQLDGNTRPAEPRRETQRLSTPERISIDPDDSPMLDDFLHDIMRRVHRRLGDNKRPAP